MAPRFRKKDKSVEAGFRRIAVEEIDEAIALIDSPDRTSEEKVHKVRRQLKALRGLLRLVRPAFSRFGKENRRLRDIGRALSRTRDAKVMLDTFDTITGAGRRRPLSHGFALMRERLVAAQAEQRDVEQLLGDVRDDLAAARERTKHWSLDDGGWDAIASGLADTYRDARHAMKEALVSGDALASHEWRKGVKYHGTHMKLLHRIHPHALGRREKAMSRLADLLGERHDIDMFLAALARAPAHYGDVVTVTQLGSLARLHADRLDRRARRLGEALFAEKAERLAGDWGDWWKAWRSH